MSLGITLPTNSWEKEKIGASMRKFLLRRRTSTSQFSELRHPRSAPAAASGRDSEGDGTDRNPKRQRVVSDAAAAGLECGSSTEVGTGSWQQHLRQPMAQSTGLQNSNNWTSTPLKETQVWSTFGDGARMQPAPWQSGWPQQLEHDGRHPSTEVGAQDAALPVTQLPELLQGYLGQLPEEEEDEEEERPEVSPSHRDVLLGIPKDHHVMLPKAQPVDASPTGSDEWHVTVPEKKRGRRAASQTDAIDGWVPSKNLVSERKRRKRLNESLFSLRALVPNITKMDKASILADAITHLQDLKTKVEMLEKLQDDQPEQELEVKPAPDSIINTAKSPCSTSGTDQVGATVLSRGSSLDGGSSLTSSTLTGSDKACSCDFPDQSSPAQDQELQEEEEIQLAVMKIEHGVYKLNITCRQQTGVLLQLSKAIEAFVIEIMYSSISATIPTKAICIFVVKMSSWNDMTLKEVKADIQELVAQFGLRASSKMESSGDPLEMN